MQTLNPSERRALLAYVKYGNARRAAESLGIAESTLKHALMTAREKYDAATITHLAYKLYPALGVFMEIEHVEG
jgi:DNA-directed RNA polymerase specialized sigma24 family protein